MSSPDTPMAALLLAGGKSRRMGRPKALLPADGAPLWTVQCERLEAVASGPWFLSSPPDVPLSRTGWSPISDLKADCGPLGGLAAALQACPAPHLLVLAVDLPGMTPDTLRELAKHRRAGRGVVFTSEEHFDPLAAIYPQEAAATAKRLLDDDQLKLQSLCRALVEEDLLLPVPADASAMVALRNWNRPDDHESL